MNKFNILSLALLLSVASIADTNVELIELLKSKSFNVNPDNTRQEYSYRGKNFKIDPLTGVLYYETTPGEKKVVELEWEGSKGNIKEGNKIVHRLNRRTMNKEDRAAFNALALYQRLRGIFTSKSINPECYVAYADARSVPQESLLALERNENPRPLVFKSDEQYQEFQNDLKNLFSNFKGPKSNIVILGSSSTFYSVNPSKGSSLALYVGSPQCLEDAKDPQKTVLVRTIDTPGSDLSDIDINILIPELSDLCERAMQDSSKFGNDGTRRVYIENMLDACFNASSDPNIQAMAQGGTAEEGKWQLKGKAFQDFLEKWTPQLEDRELNFSVRIRPDQQKFPAKKDNAPSDFDQDLAYEKFVIPVN